MSLSISWPKRIESISLFSGSLAKPTCINQFHLPLVAQKAQTAFFCVSCGASV